jgi:excisionase family DNA binding protein
MDKLYKVEEVAKLLNVSISCIYKKAEIGELVSIKIGSALRFSEQNIADFLKKNNREKVLIKKRKSP